MSVMGKAWVAPTIGWSYVQLVGKDVGKFLNNFCTADLKRVAPGHAQELMLLNGKGHVLAWGVGLVGENVLRLMLSGRTAAQIIEHLDAYLFSEDVQMSPWPARSWLIAGLQDLEKAEQSSAPLEVREPILSRMVGTDPAAAAESASTKKEDTWSLWQTIGNARWLVTSDTLEMPDILAETAPWRTEIASEVPWISASIGDYHRWRIQSKIPIVGQDTNANTLPQELLRDDSAISFTKGCYLGQETVARLDAMGHVNWNLRTLTLDSLWPNNLTHTDSGAPTDEVAIRSAEQTLGQLTSICGDKALARIRASAVEEFRRTQGVNWQLSMNTTPVPQKIQEII
ncbi:MAG: hypothetical protein Q8M16_04145 [Pirellulaceae bacterium]|nr:hypothetical protein [Pirellulaceae bacterium]